MRAVSCWAQGLYGGCEPGQMILVTLGICAHIVVPTNLHRERLNLQTHQRSMGGDDIDVACCQRRQQDAHGVQLTIPADVKYVAVALDPRAPTADPVCSQCRKAIAARHILAHGLDELV